MSAWPAKEARTILTAAPTPAGAARLSKARLRSLLTKAGRRRNLDGWVDRLYPIFHGDTMRHPTQVEDAYGPAAKALLTRLDAAVAAVRHLEAATQALFELHPHAEIITSFPGVGALTGARVLAEICDEPARFQDARALKAYAGAAPVTRASGKAHLVLHRKVKNHRLASAGYNWAFAALTDSPGARAHYDRRRQAGDGHAAALRNLYNRFLGQLHHCLHTATRYDEQHAFPAAGCLDPETGPVRVDERNHHGSRGSSSRAKNEEAANRISLARFSSLTSRFSSLTSRSRSLMRRASSVVVPGRLPTSISACLTQPTQRVRVHPAPVPIRVTAAATDSCASSSRASCTSRIARSRSSCGYFLGAGITLILSRNQAVH
jgi:hypothetical protein